MFWGWGRLHGPWQQPFAKLGHLPKLRNYCHASALTLALTLPFFWRGNFLCWYIRFSLNGSYSRLFLYNRYFQTFFTFGAATAPREGFYLALLTLLFTFTFTFTFSSACVFFFAPLLFFSTDPGRTRRKSRASSAHESFQTQTWDL